MPVKEINTEEKIANLEDKIARLQEQLSNKKTSAAKKAAQKQIKLLENKLNQLIGFNSLSVGDWVCNGQPDLPGQIVELKQENECYEAWVIWDNETAPKPYAPSILTKQNLDLFIWAWDNDDKALTRLFDRKKCDDFGTLLAYIKTFQSSIKKALDEPTKLEISKKIGLVHKQWNELVKDKFRKGDRVRYNNQNATIIEYQYAGALLYIQIKFDDGEYLLVSPENLELLCLAQQILNVEPTVTYPCTKEIAIASITRDRSLQQRVQLDWSTVGEYCEVLKNGEKLAPVQLVLDDRGNYWLWDGFHTIEAHINNQQTFVEARITRGSYDDAFKLSLGANAKRGLKLSREDKYNKVNNAILANLTDETGKPLSNRAIAQLCCVSHSMVNDIKKRFSAKVKPQKPQNLELIKPENLQTNPDPLTKEESNSPLEPQEAKPPKIETSEASQPIKYQEIASIEEIDQTAIVSGVSTDDKRSENNIVYVKEDVIYVKNTSTDKRLVGYLGSAGMVLENHSHSVDLLFWGENIIKNVAKEDVGLMQQKVNILARIPTKQLAILIQKFKTPEDAIASFTDQLTANEF